MRGILEKLYHGNLSVSDRTFKRGTPYAKALNRMTEAEEKLTKLLPEDQCALLKEYVDSAHDLSAAAGLEDFIIGYQMGVRFTLAAFDDSGCFTPIGE